jgi:hypothetical protein
MPNNIVEIKNKWIKDAEIFGEGSISTNIGIYAKRNQGNIEKGKLDNRNGKIGEMVVHSYLLSTFPDLTEPDFAIYTSRNKSWAKDLYSETTNKKFGVKSQTIESAKKYNESWVFQNEDTGIHGKKDKSDDDNFIVFVLLDLKEKLGYIRAVVKVKWLHENGLFKPMKLAHLVSKKAVYFDDLKKYKKELWQV